MGSYNYREAVVDDVYDYLVENEIKWTADTRDDVAQQLDDDLWVEDSVTGNGSGSYTFDREKARNLVQGDPDALDLIREMCREFGVESDEIAEKFLDEDYEWFDVSLRCYLLNQSIWEAMDKVEAENPYDWEGEE